MSVNPCMFNPYMNFFMPMNYFQIFPMPLQNSILQQADYYIPKLEDSLVISEGKNTESSKSVSAETEIQEAKNTEKKKEKIIIKGVEYNKKNGEALAQRVLAGLPAKASEPLCAKYVKEAVRDTGLGDYVNGNGEYCKYIFRANPNFKEVRLKGDELSKLPAGCIIVYDAYEPCTDKNGKTENIGEDGHVLITLGNGKGCSDRLEDDILKSDRLYTFIPV